MVSLHKATPNKRSDMHQIQVRDQLTSVKKKPKGFGAEANKSSNYNYTPDRYHNEVLEQRVFKSPMQNGAKKMKQRPMTAKKYQNSFGKSEFSNP